MNAEKRLAMDLLDAVWKEDVEGVEYCLQLGASPSWVFNGYPILMHAISAVSYTHLTLPTIA